MGSEHQHGGHSNLLRVASYNVHKCIGMDGRFDPRRVADVIQSLDADIIALQEADARFGKKAGLLDPGYLEGLGGYKMVASAPATSLSHGWHGNVVLYRKGEVERIRRISLPGLEPRGAVAVDFKWHGQTLHFIATHFGLLRLSRQLQAKAIRDYVLEHTREHVVAVGDFNEWRQKRRSGLTPFGTLLREATGWQCSYPSAYPVLALDRIFISDCIESVSARVLTSELAEVASDHLPIVADLRLLDAPVSTGPAAWPAGPRRVLELMRRRWTGT
ncbi:endonuclease/exonuclease/phosphatase family protein [Aestuariivirga sp.]|uniref:endonuclease/exonuclease/phosphatase family protein n=1 Tax=Aestuariivirga sp. TaxID=2650926 RepID=UPI0039E4F027